MKKNSIPKLELVFLLLLTGMCPQAHATDDGRNASPQKTYAVDLTLGSATVLTFTEAVTSQTGVLFSYESALSQMPLGDVSVHETAAPLEHILEKVFKGRGFRYKVVDRIVVLTYDTDSARSQLVLVTGRVKDGSGTPLVGASVVVKGTMRGAKLPLWPLSHLIPELLFQMFIRKGLLRLRPEISPMPKRWAVPSSFWVWPRTRRME